MKARFVIAIALFLVLWATPVLAQGGQDLPDTIEGLIVSLYSGSVRIVGLVAFLMLLYAGLLRLVGKGSESNQVILDAVIGTVLLLSAVVILNSINPDLVEQGSGVGRVRSQTGAAMIGSGNPAGSIVPIIVQ